MRCVRSGSSSNGPIPMGTTTARMITIAATRVITPVRIPVRPVSHWPAVAVAVRRGGLRRIGGIIITVRIRRIGRPRGIIVSRGDGRGIGRALGLGHFQSQFVPVVQSEQALVVP